MLINVDYHITDNCNLNCISCGHFCPLVSTETMRSLDQVREDLSLLHHRLRGNLDTLTLTGGEVTLHPQLEDIIKIAHKLFPKVKLWSNGVLYKRLINLKNLLIETGTLLCITDYGPDVNRSNIDLLSTYFGDQLMYIERHPDDKTIFNDGFFKINGSVTDEVGVLNCEPRQYCTQLAYGKLYPCQYLAYGKYFNQCFEGHGLNLGIPDKCFIDLRTTKLSPEEIEQWLKTYQCGLCYHCMDCMPNRPTQEWRRSNHNPSEWVKE